MHRKVPLERPKYFEQSCFGSSLLLDTFFHLGMQNSKFFKFDSDLGAGIVNCGSCWCCVTCGDCLECALAHSLLVQNRFVRGGIFWTVPVCKGLSASASYGCDVCAIQIRTESSQGATVFVLLAWTPAFIRKERGVLMDNIRGRSRPLAYIPIPIL